MRAFELPIISINSTRNKKAFSVTEKAFFKLNDFVNLFYNISKILLKDIA